MYIILLLLLSDVVNYVGSMASKKYFISSMEVLNTTKNVSINKQNNKSNVMCDISYAEVEMIAIR